MVAVVLQVVQKQQQELQQQASSHTQQLEAIAREHQAAATVMQEQLAQAASGTDEATQQLQQMQLQQAQQQLEQQLKQQSLEHQLQQHQQRQQQLEAREMELQQQLAGSKAQAKELAGQLRKCSDKLNQQTQAVHALKRTLESTQDQLAIASNATRDQNMSITQQAIAAEKERFRAQQLLHSEQAAALKLQQQLQGLQQQLQEQQAAGEAAAAQHALEVGRLAEQLALKDQSMEHLQSSLAALQGRLTSQQNKVRPLSPATKGHPALIQSYRLLCDSTWQSVFQDARNAVCP
jgi:chromosome segregation ATPase